MRALALLLGVIALLAAALPGAEPAAPRVERLIDELTKISEPGIGYSGLFAGSEFLPYDDTEELGTFVFGGTARERSPVLRELVTLGPEAIPSLLAHSGDERKIAMPPVAGMMWMKFDDEYDFNRYTVSEPPIGVNRDQSFDEDHPESHVVTVGDLCFVALGQIVNRQFTATRYQPSGGMIVSSPTYSRRLRDAILKEWGDLTPAEHRRRLCDDFTRADYARRRLGAYRRLSLYYPDALDELVPTELATPTFDFTTVEEFREKQLYRASNDAERRRLYDEFLRKHGPHYAAPLRDQLFRDLRDLEEVEQGRMPRTSIAFDEQPRKLLILLFGYPGDAKSSARPRLDVAENYERTRLIAAMTHDDSRAIGEAVRKLYLARPDDPDLGPACLKCLANRGYGEFLAELVDRIDLAAVQSDPLQLERLRSLASSTDPLVQRRLLHVVETTANDEYFAIAAAGLRNLDDDTLRRQARRLLGALPPDTSRGGPVLTEVARRSPQRGAELVGWFLEPDTAERAMTVAEFVRYSSPFPNDVLVPLLLPLLDEPRRVERGQTLDRVCDIAAQTLSYHSHGIEFNIGWSVKLRDEMIGKLKQRLAKNK